MNYSPLVRLLLIRWGRDNERMLEAAVLCIRAACRLLFSDKSSCCSPALGRGRQHAQEHGRAQTKNPPRREIPKHVVSLMIPVFRL